MAQITLPHQLSNGTVADASQVMANFNAIVDVVNGNLESDNIQNIAGSDITVPDIDGGNISLDDFASRFQAGRVWVPPNPDEVVDTSVVVEYPRPFPGEPAVFLQHRTALPHRRFVSYEPGESTRYSFRLYIRSDVSPDTGFYVSWLAVYYGSL